MRKISQNNVEERNNSSEEGGPRSAKQHVWSREGEGLVATNSPVIPTRNYFAPLRMDEADMNSAGENGAQQQTTSMPKAVGRPPPVIITVSLNLNGIKVVTKDTADYSALTRCLESSKIAYYTFHLQSLKLAKTVIRHLPGDTPAKDISDELLPLASISSM
jgi:hypothetical protein